MGGVNSKADGEVFPQDAPSIWSHVPGPRGYEDADEGLQLPPCKIISDFGTFDGLPTGMPTGHGYLKEIVELPRQTKEIVEVPKPKEQSPVKIKEQSPKALPATEKTEKTEKTEVPETEVHSAGPQELHGKRKSLLIGINYFGSSNELHGCVDDVHRMLPLVEQWGFAQEGCSQVLLDSPGHHKPPTKANIQAAIAWLVQGAAPGDTLFFHYSGHGGRVPRTDGRGEWHETLCPVDMDEAGMIHDNELFEMLVKPLPKGCRLTCILDACHSAGALDLPFIFTGTPENIKKAMTGEAIQMALSKNWVRDFELMEADNPMALLGDVASVGLGLWDMWKQYKAKTEANQDGFCPDEPGNIGMTSAEVVAITGCASDQTSADVGDVHSQFDLKNTAHGGQIRQGAARGDAGGALTCAFIEAMETVQSQHGPDGKVSILELLEHLQGRLAEGGFSQVPQLASSLVLDLKQPFSLTTVVGQSTGNNLSDGTSTRTLPGGAGASNGGLLGSVGNGLGTALAGSALGGYGGPMGGMGMGGMGGMGGVGGMEGMGGMGPMTSPPVADGGFFGSLGSLGAWSGLFGNHQENQEATAAVPTAGYMSGDEYDDEAFDDDNFGEEDFEDDYSDYDED